MADEFVWGTGRRKTSVARVKLKKGTGQVEVNRQKAEDYFSRERDWTDILKPLKDTKKMEEYDVQAFVKGGGYSGQAGAILLGLARALAKMEDELGEVLRKKGHLTRDARMKERKKYGQRGARRSFQFSKR